ncbi:Protein CBG04959 [Caenorhabditis briggsae]|uniref:Protein CBG04959 n=1 Tax=Caenorhabditis briggsae TaxID=6238 RepID=A8WYW3_CAEBR|nr:Protein CBG04959 [Caenorhabditis briggsae]CAP25571.1 Protein CBG04959 [Caenorhabditis briggsae]
MSSIIEMPEFVLEKIIGFSNFKDVLTLRQVCRDFRNFIDDLKDSKLPDSNFKEMEIVSKKDENKIVFAFADFGGTIYRIEYSEFGNSRNFQETWKIFENSNIVDVAIRDLELVLRFQKSKLYRIYFDVNDFQLSPDSSIYKLSVKLSNLCIRINRKIKTEQLYLKKCNQSQIMKFIQFTDPEALEKLSFFADDDDIDDRIEIEIDDIAKTEQWKKAEEFKCDFQVLNLDARDICHFTSMSIKTHSISASDLEFLKKTFINSSTFVYAFFELTIFNGNEIISNLWGPAFITELSRNWYFRIKDLEDEVLHIEIRQNFINFHVFEWRYVLTGARVQDYNES